MNAIYTKSIFMKKFTLSKVSKANALNWLKKYRKIILTAKEKWLNESDTSNIINDILGEVLWYDKFFDVTTEYKIRWQYCDYWVKINNKLTLLIEVKAISIELNENHLFQATSYASNEWVQYVILTNLKEWRLYHLKFWKKVEYDLILNVNLTWPETNLKILDLLQLLHKESFIKKAVDDLWKQKVASSKENIKKALLSQWVVRKILSELKVITWVRITQEEVENNIKSLFN